MILQAFLIFSIGFLLIISASKSKPKIKGKYKELPEMYSYRENLVQNENEANFETENVLPSDLRTDLNTNHNILESYLSIAVSEAEHLEWSTLGDNEMPRGDNSELTAEFTNINVPIFYGMDAEKYGIDNESIKKSFFSIYLRKYHWGTLNNRKPVKHVILVAGGPGESGQSWIRQINKLSRQYGRDNLIFYVADHRGVFKSRDIVELIKKEYSEKSGNSRISWRRVRRSESVDEHNWIKNVAKFENDVGYPLVAMTCSNAARDLGIISLVIRRKEIINSNDKFYLHAQSYGTQVATRTLNMLPEFYDAVLLEGLATMELVKESAKADFGILSSCAEDSKCSQMFLKSNVPRNRLPLTSPFDLKNLLEGMTNSIHNRPCRDLFLTLMRQYVYSESVTFWDAINLSFYELLSDDFINPYSGAESDFYPGMLVLPFIRDMYYCEDRERFRRQVNKIIEMIAISVRGLKQPYVKTPSREKVKKNKPVDAKQQTSHFVQTYINLHEAFDMGGMLRISERGYCDNHIQGDLINQCPIWREQVRKMDILKGLSSEKKLKSSEGRKKTKKGEMKIDKFEGKVDGDDVGKKGKGYESSSSSSSSSSTSSDISSLSSRSTSSSSSKSSSLDTSDSGSIYKSIIKTIQLFTFGEETKKSTKRGGKRDVSGVKGKKSQKYPEQDDDYSEDDSSDDDYGSDDSSNDEENYLPNFKKSLKSKSKNPDKFKRFYYDLDELAFQAPNSHKTKIFVTVGSLDIKTPILEARRLLSRIGAPLKVLFELKNIGHSTEPCRGEILRAFTADNEEKFGGAMRMADECVRELGIRRKLDWELRGVKNIPRDDWIE